MLCMKAMQNWAKACYGRAQANLLPHALRGRQAAVARFNQQPQITSAVLVFVLGLLAILTGLPTQQGSTTLAGALFGAGAAFIGGWVVEKNRTSSEKIAEARRAEAARIFFTPELARIVAQHPDGPRLAGDLGRNRTRTCRDCARDARNRLVGGRGDRAQWRPGDGPVPGLSPIADHGAAPVGHRPDQRARPLIQGRSPSHRPLGGP